MGSGTGALVFWLFLYVIPIGLLIKHWESRADIARRAFRFVSTWGIAYCLLAALVAGAMSGTVGFIGNGIAALLWVVWGSICFAAIRRTSSGPP